MRNAKLYKKIYEDNFGKIPKGYHIHHKDGNHENNDPSNLLAVTPEEHAKLHLEMGIMWKGGDHSRWIIGASEAGVMGGKSLWNNFTLEQKSERARLMNLRSSKFLGKKCSDEHKEKLKSAMINKPMWTCECGKTMRLLQGNLKQHKRKCKSE